MLFHLCLVLLNGPLYRGFLEHFIHIHVLIYHITYVKFMRKHCFMRKPSVGIDGFIRFRTPLI
jgi:hypothetical protein